MIQIKDIDVYEKPKKYLAITSKDGNVYEVQLRELFKYLFLKDSNLMSYYYQSKTIGDTLDLYYDLIDLGKDLKQDLLDYIDSKDYKGKPIPKDVYPIVLRYYQGKVSLSDLIILQKALDLDLDDLGLSPDQDDFKGGWDLDPGPGDDPMPF